jgi:hypothetical protein
MSTPFKIPEPKRTGCFKTTDGATFDDSNAAKKHEVILAMRRTIISLLPTGLAATKTLSPGEVAEMILKRNEDFYPMIQAYRRLS